MGRDMASAAARAPLALVAALFVETGGVYFDLPGCDPWDRERDARKYRGPHPVVAHPPCERWGRYAETHPIKGKIADLGDDGGKFFHALWCVRTFGGVIEHPKDSHAWEWFGLMRPAPKGWQRADSYGGWTCQVDQGHYDHFARKSTWLYAAGCELPSLIWGAAEQRIHPVALAKHGYAKARRIGMTAMIGGKHKKAIRERTPAPFRDLLLSIARSERQTLSKATEEHELVLESMDAWQSFVTWNEAALVEEYGSVANAFQHACQGGLTLGGGATPVTRISFAE